MYFQVVYITSLSYRNISNPYLKTNHLLFKIRGRIRTYQSAFKVLMMSQRSGTRAEHRSIKSTVGTWLGSQGGYPKVFVAYVTQPPRNPPNMMHQQPDRACSTQLCQLPKTTAVPVRFTGSEEILNSLSPPPRRSGASATERLVGKQGWSPACMSHL